MREVTMWRASDGTLFDTRLQAEAYEQTRELIQLVQTKYPDIADYIIDYIVAVIRDNFVLQPKEPLTEEMPEYSKRYTLFYKDGSFVTGMSESYFDKEREVPSLVFAGLEPLSCKYLWDEHNCRWYYVENGLRQFIGGQS